VEACGFHHGRYCLIEIMLVRASMMSLLRSYTAIVQGVVCLTLAVRVIRG
jgi:hypothetical protein